MKPEIIGIRRVYKNNDKEMYRKTVIHCNEIGKDGKIHAKSVVVTEAEKWILESIAMHLFLHHKKYVDFSKTSLGDDFTEIKGLLTVERY